MADPKSPKPPQGLGNTGRALWWQVLRALPAGWQFDEREEATLALAARQRDDLAKLETVIKRDGVMSVGSTGQPTCHPAVGEARQARLAIGRLLGALHLPDSDEKPATTASQRGQRAANARWTREHRIGPAR